MLPGIPTLYYGLFCLVIKGNDGYYQGLVWSKVTGELWDHKDSFNTPEDAIYWCRTTAAAKRGRA